MKQTLQFNAAIFRFLFAFIVCCFVSLSGFSQTVTCPSNTDLGTFDCTNIDDVPDPVNMLEEAMAAPYNLGIDGIVPTTRVVVQDSGTIFYCADDDRMITRTVIIYNDDNFNFIYDDGEEVGICTFQIETVPDTTPPTFEAPMATTTTCALGYDPNQTGDVTVVEDDNCPVLNTTDFVFFADAIADGSCLGELIVTRSWTSTDPCGNTSPAQTQMIVVMDDEGPVFTVPADITLECGQDPNDSAITGVVTDAMDECDPSEILVNGIIIPDLTMENMPCPGSTVYTKRWGAVDNCGNPTTADQTITVLDTTPPEFDVPADVDLACGDATPAPPTDIVATDSCDPNGIAVVFEGSVVTPDGAPDCEARTMTRTWTATDACNNTTTKTQTITFPACAPVCNTDPCVGDVTVLAANGCNCEVTEAQVLGCTDAAACNYDSNANCDDGSCEALPVCNTDPCAGDITTLNGCSCEVSEPQVLGCTDAGACNYDPNANCDDGSCAALPVCNTDPCAGDITQLDSSGCGCELVEASVTGCDDPNAYNYNPGANCPADCEYFDLALTKTLITPGPISAGSGTTLTFSIEVINEGDVTATNIIVNDFPPAGLILADANWTDTGSYSTITIPGPLAAGETTSVEVSYTLSADAGPGSYTNIAEIGGATDEDGNPVDDVDSTPDDDPNNDPDGEDDRDTETWEIVCDTPTCNSDPCAGDITVLNAEGCGCVVSEPQVTGCDDSTAQNYNPDANCPSACEYFDLALQKSLVTTGPVAIVPGATITYAITVYNQGDVTATNISVNDFPPAGLILSDSNWSSTGGASNIVIAGPLAPGASTTVEITYSIDPSATPGTLRNIAEIESAEDENGNPGNDVDSKGDNDPNNDTTVDDEIDNGGDDEDDNDIADVELVPGCTPITITSEVDCNENIGQYSVSFSITGGAPSTSGGTYQVTGSFNGSVNPGQQYLIYGLSDGSNYTINVIDDGNGCTESFSDGPIECVKLPINLLSYTGDVLSEGNILKWTTASEINNSFFTLERATPSLEFETIATIDGSGTTSSPSSYEFFDREAPNGISYYQLSQTDYDGTTEIVGVIQLIRSESDIQLINVFPMPILDNVELYISSEEDQNIQLQIFNSIGELMFENQYELKTALNKVDLDLANLASGVYVISLIEGENVISNKVIKH